EQAPGQVSIVDGVAGSIAPGGLPPDRTGEADGSKEQAASDQVLVPVAFNKNVACRSPDIVRRDPDPARPMADPIGRPPTIQVYGPAPGTRNHDAVGGRRGNRRLRIERLGRRRQELLFRLVYERPVTGGPLIAPFDLRPGAGHPLAARRWNAPN